jgi:hypothetical protein
VLAVDVVTTDPLKERFGSSVVACLAWSFYAKPVIR